jgi:hypothetical protein
MMLATYYEITCAATHYDPTHDSSQASKLPRVAVSLALTHINSIVDESQLTRMAPD